MLHDRHEDFIAGREQSAIGIGHKIDGLGGAARKDDFLIRSGAKSKCYAMAHVLETVCRLLRNAMDAAVDVGMMAGIHLIESVEDACRGLRSGGIVQIDKRTIVDLAAEYGKLAADIFYV